MSGEEPGRISELEDRTATLAYALSRLVGVVDALTVMVADLRAERSGGTIAASLPELENTLRSVKRDLDAAFE